MASLVRSPVTIAHHKDVAIRAFSSTCICHERKKLRITYHSKGGLIRYSNEKREANSSGDTKSTSGRPSGRRLWNASSVKKMVIAPSIAEKSKNADLPPSLRFEYTKESSRYVTTTRTFLDQLAKVEAEKLRELLVSLEAEREHAASTVAALAKGKEGVAKASGLVSERQDAIRMLSEKSRRYTESIDNLKSHAEDLLREGTPKWNPKEIPNLGNVPLSEWYRQEAEAKGTLQSMMEKYRAFVDPGSKAIDRFIKASKQWRGLSMNGRAGVRRRMALNELSRGLQEAEAAFQGYGTGQDGRTMSRDDVKLSLGRMSKREAARVEDMDQMFRYEAGEKIEDAPELEDFTALDVEVEDFRDSPY
ncbi:hypothetical protein CAC42_3301 [Sphaceloma murrayae]|uniref:Uncharacterized protein n=1 Tax=Sphaceloma murrayae TaxID=2082308 RepID=A0A2K1QFG8_9PEZI|nr:hypothetical protein CAC42_3301 [Sphaceloma murrayae]